MRRIPTKMHGVADYVTSAALLAAPLLINERKNGPETIIPMALGASTLVTSLLTDYELGAAKKIKMPTHLAIDIASGVFLAASPWIFGFSKRTWVPHVAIGLMEIAIALSTETEPYLQEDDEFDDEDNDNFYDETDDNNVDFEIDVYEITEEEYEL